MGSRFVFRPLSAESMEVVGNRVIAEVVKSRIASGINVYDQPAKPLKPGRNGGYASWKASHGLRPIRDLFARGRTLRSIRVISATANQVRIGFDNPQAARVAAANQRADPAFWFSPNDQGKIGRIIQEEIQNGAKLVTTEGA